MANLISTAPATAAASGSRLIQLTMAGLLGLFVLGVAGFAHIEAVHNAAHDVRHSLAFPCH